MVGPHHGGLPGVSGTRPRRPAASACLDTSRKERKTTGGFGGPDQRILRPLWVNVGVGFRYVTARLLGLSLGFDVARGPEDTVFYLHGRQRPLTPQGNRTGTLAVSPESTTSLPPCTRPSAVVTDHA